jgi:F-type H+-transporting ATPase subunit gamma
VASLKSIRKRISSVRNTQQITKAMKMVAAARLRRAQQSVEGARPYAEKLTELLGRLAAASGDLEHPFLAAPGSAPAHVVVLSADRGLCGAYNSNILKLADAFRRSDEGRDAGMTICGRRGRDYFRKRSGNIVQEHVNLSGGLDRSLAGVVARDVSERFVSGKAGSVYIVYSRFASALSQKPTLERLLPMATVATRAELETSDASGPSQGPEYVYEPDADTILSALLPQYVEVKIFQAMLDATASEHGARMTAMESASRNASEMIERLTLEMNRARQAAITKELMEIIGGAEALNA